MSKRRNEPHSRLVTWWLDPGEQSVRHHQQGLCTFLDAVLSTISKLYVLR